MLPWIIVDTVLSPDGTDLVLARHDSEWEIRTGRLTLMSSRMNASEASLVRLAFEAAPHTQTVLLGGLGLGFSLRAVLDQLPPNGHIVLAELSEAVVRWNREHVGGLADHPLTDARVDVSPGDVFDRISEGEHRYDAIVLDVDNGPVAFSQTTNHRLYGDEGVRLCLAALRPGGVLTVWSAGPDADYLRRLSRAGFAVTARSVAARSGGRKRHVIFVARRP
jgi:spermidine synthase